MELRDYIEIGISKFGTITKLAEELGLQRESLSAAKAHRRGLPAYAISKLARILEIDPQVVTAASELVTERNEEKRRYWLPFVTNAQNFGKMASYALILGIVTNFVTAYPAEAAPVLNFASLAFCIM